MNNLSLHPVTKVVKESLWIDNSLVYRSCLEIFPSFLINKLNEVKIIWVREINWEISFLVEFIKTKKKSIIRRNWIFLSEI